MHFLYAFTLLAANWGRHSGVQHNTHSAHSPLSRQQAELFLLEWDVRRHISTDFTAHFSWDTKLKISHRGAGKSQQLAIDFSLESLSNISCWAPNQSDSTGRTGRQNGYSYSQWINLWQVSVNEFLQDWLHSALMNSRQTFDTLHYFDWLGALCSIILLILSSCALRRRKSYLQVCKASKPVEAPFTFPFSHLCFSSNSSVEQHYHPLRVSYTQVDRRTLGSGSSIFSSLFTPVYSSLFTASFPTKDRRKRCFFPTWYLKLSKGQI